MKLTFHLLIVALLAVFAFATAEQKPVIVSYASNTPQSVLEQAKDAIIKAGGIITHEYTLIKAFAATASEQALETVQSLGTQNHVVIEEDQVVNGLID